MAPKRKQPESTALVESDGDKKVWIYTVIDKRSGVVRYVGQTDNLKRRWKQHISKDSDCARLRDEIQAVGFQMFKIEIVEEVACGIPKSVAHLYEAYYMEHYNTIFNRNFAPHGLNIGVADHRKAWYIERWKKGKKHEIQKVAARAKRIKAARAWRNESLKDTQHAQLLES